MELKLGRTIFDHCLWSPKLIRVFAVKRVTLRNAPISLWKLGHLKRSRVSLKNYNRILWKNRVISDGFWHVRVFIIILKIKHAQDKLWPKKQIWLKLLFVYYSLFLWHYDVCGIVFIHLYLYLRINEILAMIFTINSTYCFYAKDNFPFLNE